MDASTIFQQYYTQGMGKGKANETQKLFNQLPASPTIPNYDADKLTEQFTKAFADFIPKTKNFGNVMEQLANQARIQIQIDKDKGKLNDKLSKGFNNLSNILEKQILKNYTKEYNSLTQNIIQIQAQNKVLTEKQKNDIKELESQRKGAATYLATIKAKQRYDKEEKRIANENKKSVEEATKTFTKFSKGFSENLKSKVSSKIEKVPMIGGDLASAFGMKWDKSVTPKIEKTLSKLVFKGGTPAGGLSIGKVAGLAGGIMGGGLIIKGIMALINGIVAVIKSVFKFIKAIVDKAVELDAYALKIGKSFGLASNNAKEMGDTIQATARSLVYMGIETEKIQENAGALLKAFGSIEGVTSDNLETVTKLTERWGVAADSAATMTMALQRIMGYGQRDTDNFFSTLQGQASVAGVSFGGIVEDIANNMDLWVTAGVKNVSNLTKAAIQAKKVGLSLDVVGKIQENFEDLESTIEKSQYINFITGSNLNPMKLYSMSQMGDVAGLMDEAFEVAQKMGKSFNTQPATIQKDLAKMFGLSVQEFSKLANTSRKTYEQERQASKDWAKSLEQINDLFETIKALGKGIVSSVITPFAEALKPVIGKWREGINSVSKRLSEVFSAKNNKKMIDSIGNSIQKIFYPKEKNKKGFWEVVGDALVGLSKKFQAFFVETDKNGSTAFENLMKKVKTFYDEAVVPVVDKLSAIFNPEEYGNGKNFWQNIGDKLKDVVKATMDSLAGPFTDILLVATHTVVKTIFGKIPLIKKLIPDDKEFNDLIKNRKLDRKSEDLNKQMEKLQSNDYVNIKMFDDLTKKQKELKDTRKGDVERQFIEHPNTVYGTESGTVKNQNFLDKIWASIKTNVFHTYDPLFELAGKQGLYDLAKEQTYKNYNDKFVENTKGLKISMYPDTPKVQSVFKASGGMVFGAGTGTSDSIPANLSNGEFVVNAQGTSKFRPVLETMNLASGSPSSGSSDIFNSMHSLLELMQGNTKDIKVILKDTQNITKKGLLVNDTEPFLKNVWMYYDNKLLNYKKKAIDEFNRIQGEIMKNSSDLSLASGGIINAAGGANLSSAMAYERQAMKHTGVGFNAKPFAFKAGKQTVVANTGENFYPISGAKGLAVVNPLQQSVLNQTHPNVASTGKITQSAIKTLGKYFPSFNKAYGGTVNNYSIGGFIHNLGAEWEDKVNEVAGKLGVPAEWLMMIMEIESGFKPTAKSSVGSAAGLFQWTNSTAKSLGTSTEEILKMSAIDQMDIAYKYFEPYKGKFTSPADMYLVNFFPAALGQSLDWIFQSGDLSAETVATKNPVFDLNKDKKITLSEFYEWWKKKYGDKGLGGTTTGTGGGTQMGLGYAREYEGLQLPISPFLMGAMPSPLLTARTMGSSSMQRVNDTGQVTFSQQYLLNQLSEAGGIQSDASDIGIEGPLMNFFYQRLKKAKEGTGESFDGSGSRTHARQKEIASSKGKLAATPGNSRHEYGLAIDTTNSYWKGKPDSSDQTTLKKYGLWLPLWPTENGKFFENWHIEPMGPNETRIPISSGTDTIFPDNKASGGIIPELDVSGEKHYEALGGLVNLVGGGVTSPTPYTFENTPNVRLIYEAAIAEGITDPNQLAYIMATAQGESGFEPIKEKLANPNDPRQRGLYRQQMQYFPSGYMGRGFTQLTWKDNYKNAQEKLKLSELGIDIVKNPELALDPRIAAKIMVRGMKEGWFTTKKLSDFDKNGNFDYYNARTIINGHFKADEYAKNAKYWKDQVKQYQAKEQLAKVKDMLNLAKKIMIPGGNNNAAEGGIYNMPEGGIGDFAFNLGTKGLHHIHSVMKPTEIAHTGLETLLKHKKIANSVIGKGLHSVLNSKLISKIPNTAAAVQGLQSLLQMKKGSYVSGANNMLGAGLTAFLPELGLFYNLIFKPIFDNLGDDYDAGKLLESGDPEKIAMAKKYLEEQKIKYAPAQKYSQNYYNKNARLPGQRGYLYGGGVIKAANGYSGLVDSPTMFLAGEQGLKEQVDIKKPEDTNDMLQLLREISNKLSDINGSNFKFVEVSEDKIAKNVIGYIVSQTQS